MPEEFAQQLLSLMSAESELRRQLAVSSLSPLQRRELQKQLEATISEHAKLELRIWQWELDNVLLPDVPDFRPSVSKPAGLRTSRRTFGFLLSAWSKIAP